MNELVEECKDYTVKEMKPTLDILFNAYDYEKKQHQIMDTLSAEEYDRVVKALKVNRTMGLRLKSDTTCCCCGKSLIQTMDNGLKDKVVLFGCGHATHCSCLDSVRCPAFDGSEFPERRRIKYVDRKRIDATFHIGRTNKEHRLGRVHRDRFHPQCGCASAERHSPPEMAREGDQHEFLFGNGH